MTVRFRFDWLDSGPSPDKLSQVTMAALRIHADGAPVTAVVDRRDRRYSDTINVPLFGVAEWLVLNWFSIWHEVADTVERSPEFESRHNLAFAGDGFALPRLFIAPASSARMKLEWSGYRPLHARVEFLDQGSQSVARGELEREFRTLIDAVLQRTQENPETRPASDDLGRIWGAVNNLGDDEREFSRAAALFGADPFDMEHEAAELVIEFWKNADSSIRDDALALAGGTGLPPLSDWLNRARNAVAQRRTSTDWSEIREALPPPSSTDLPWERGYELARLARGHIGGNGGAMNLQQGPAAVPHEELIPPSTRIQAFVGKDGPGCVMARRHPLSTRFIQARSLGDFLGRGTPGFGLLSSLDTERQAQSRAFAAEFLAPSASLRQFIGAARVDGERIDDLGREFDVSTAVIEHQIRNHRIAEIAAY